MEAAVRRLDVLAHHVAASQSEVVICAAFRTPFTKANVGVFKDVPLETMLTPVLEKIISATGIDPAKIEDIVVGNVIEEGSGLMAGRVAQMLAGIPYTTSLNAINGLCSSSLQACVAISNQIKAGEIEIGIAAGFEKMSKVDLAGMVDPKTVSPAALENGTPRDCVQSIACAAENIAEMYLIPRKEQDQLVIESHKKAVRAYEMGLLDAEIVPVEVTLMIGGEQKKVIVSKDDGISKNVTLESLSAMPPAVKRGGCVTHGNMSAPSDGAAAVLLASRAAAKKHNLPILARWVGFAISGVAPNAMCTGPLFAIPKVLEKTGLRMSDIDIFELNETFGSMFVHCVKTLNIPKEKLNPKGGSLTFGHPLASTGVRQIATLIAELKRTNKRYGLVSMCVATGMGAAAIIENIN